MPHWHKHIPFAAALVSVLKPGKLVELGVYKGDSYCAFCEAVEALGLDTLCYGVDTWQGDVHVGQYGDEIYQDLRRFHDERFSRFSSLLRESFDEAARHFGAGSIDLLHIDGCHTEQAVLHDFDTWRPKLSDRAVVLFHDINVRERDYGVWKAWEQIKREGPFLEIPYGHGLGVVVLGAFAPVEIVELCRIPESDRVRLLELYHALGERVLLTGRLRGAEARIAQLDAHAARQESTRLEMEAALSRSDAERQAVQRDLAATELSRAQLRQDVEQLRLGLQHTREQYEHSTSWRLTAPLRALARIIRRSPEH
jgi:hypothetical protein